jgi:hypothetical protein
MSWRIGRWEDAAGTLPQDVTMSLRPVVDRWLTYPSENMKVRWDFYSQYIYIYIYIYGKIKVMFQTTNQ